MNIAKIFKNNLFYRTTPVAPLKHLLKYFINPFVPNAPFFYPLKTRENHMVFWCFPGVEKGCIGDEWVKNEMFKNYKNLTVENIDSNYKLPTQLSENLLKKKIFSEYERFLWLLYKPFNVALHAICQTNTCMVFKRMET